MLNISSNLQRCARVQPDKVAIHYADQSITFAELNNAANQITNALRNMGIGKGDKVALLCPNLPHFPMVYFAILKLGAVVVPVNVLLKGAEIAYYLQDSDAKAFFCFQGTAALDMGQEGFDGFNLAEQCEHFIMMTAAINAPSPIEGTRTLAQIMAGQSSESDCALLDENDTAVILYTSGTTGKPKGAELTHANIFTNTTQCNLLMKSSGQDIHLITLPLFHSFAQAVQMNAAIQVGATMVLLPRFEPDAVLAAMQKYRVTLFVGVPTMYIALLGQLDTSEQYNMELITSNLRIGVSGGAPLPVQVIHAFEQKFKVALLEGYGLSETSPAAAFTFLDIERIPGSVGQPLWGVEIELRDEHGQSVAVGEIGEICIRGCNVMKGYYKRPEETSKAIRNGWFYTGDLGKIDASGNVFVVDRVKDMILRGGYNVYPREIEEVLMTHPAIAQAAVVGVPESSLGEEVKAFVILKPNAQLTEQDLIVWAREKMASYKYPRLVSIVSTLPMTATGKVLKRQL